MRSPNGVIKDKVWSDLSRVASVASRRQQATAAARRCIDGTPFARQGNRLNNDNGMIGRRLTRREALTLLGACAPLPGALVHAWHCDATGRSSDSRRQLLVDAVPDGQGYAAAFVISLV